MKETQRQEGFDDAPTPRKNASLLPDCREKLARAAWRRGGIDREVLEPK